MKCSNVLTSCCVLSVLLCLAGISWGESYTISNAISTDDGWTDKGSGGYLFVHPKRWAALQFDLSNPASESIDSVSSAIVSIKWVTGAGVNQSYNVWRITDDFDESQSPWYSSIPAYDDSAVLQFNLTEVTNGAFFNLDVSSLLVNNGNKTTFGVVIQATEWNPYFDAKIYSRESAGSQPKLSAEYTTVPEPTTMLLLAGGSLGMLIRKKRD